MAKRKIGIQMPYALPGGADLESVPSYNDATPGTNVPEDFDPEHERYLRRHQDADDAYMRSIEHSDPALWTVRRFGQGVGMYGGAVDNITGAAGLRQFVHNKMTGRNDPLPFLFGDTGASGMDIIRDLGWTTKWDPRTGLKEDPWLGLKGMAAEAVLDPMSIADLGMSAAKFGRSGMNVAKSPAVRRAVGNFARDEGGWINPRFFDQFPRGIDLPKIDPERFGTVTPVRGFSIDDLGPNYNPGSRVMDQLLGHGTPWSDEPLHDFITSPIEHYSKNRPTGFNDTERWTDVDDYVRANQGVAFGAGANTWLPPERVASDLNSQIFGEIHPGSNVSRYSGTQLDFDTPFGMTRITSGPGFSYYADLAKGSYIDRPMRANRFGPLAVEHWGKRDHGRLYDFLSSHKQFPDAVRSAADDAWVAFNEAAEGLDNVSPMPGGVSPHEVVRNPYTGGFSVRRDLNYEIGSVSDTFPPILESSQEGIKRVATSIDPRTGLDPYGAVKSLRELMEKGMTGRTRGVQPPMEWAHPEAKALNPLFRQVREWISKGGGRELIREIDYLSKMGEL